jgi:hypothetical protein
MVSGSFGFIVSALFPSAPETMVFSAEKPLQISLAGDTICGDQLPPEPVENRRRALLFSLDVDQTAGVAFGLPVIAMGGAAASRQHLSFGLQY